MKIINITDVEELIVFKHESDKKANKKTDLQEFMTKYTNLTKIYVTPNGDSIPFEIFDINNEKVIFACFENDKIKDSFVAKLQSLKFDLSSLKEISIEQQFAMGGEMKDLFYFGSKLMK